MTDAETQLYADLATLGIRASCFEHPAVFTVAQSSAVNADIPGAHTKNLFLKDKKGRFWLVTVRAELRVDLKMLPAALGSDRLSFGSPDDMQPYRRGQSRHWQSSTIHSSLCRLCWMRRC